VRSKIIKLLYYACKYGKSVQYVPISEGMLATERCKRELK